MIVLDTNVVSELMRPQPAAAGGLGSRIHARFAALGGAADVALPPRTEAPRAARLGDDGAST